MTNRLTEASWHGFCQWGVASLPLFQCTVHHTPNTQSDFHHVLHELRCPYSWPPPTHTLERKKNFNITPFADIHLQASRMHFFLVCVYMYLSTGTSCIHCGLQHKYHTATTAPCGGSPLSCEGLLTLTSGAQTMTKTKTWRGSVWLTSY